MEDGEAGPPQLSMYSQGTHTSPAPAASASSQGAGGTPTAYLLSSRTTEAGSRPPPSAGHAHPELRAAGLLTASRLQRRDEL